MSLRAIKWAMEQQVDSGAKLVLIVLADRAGNDGRGCVLSQGQIAESASMGERTVRHHLNEMERTGLIERSRRNRKDGSRTSDRFTLKISSGYAPPQHDLPAESAGSLPASMAGRNGLPAKSAGSTPGLPAKSAGLVPTVLEPLKDTTPVVPFKNADRFDEARALYPKRGGGNPWEVARKAWNARIAEGVSAAELIEAVHRYAAFIRATDQERTIYVMQAATFFGPNERWKDDFIPPRQPAGASKVSGNGRMLTYAESQAIPREELPPGTDTRTRMQVEHDERRKAAGG